jgi:hypothetical protein
MVPLDATIWVCKDATELKDFDNNATTSFPLVQLCDTANASDAKTHWSAEELHRIMGCWKFRNYKHLLQVSCDGEWMDGGKFPSSLSSYATILKAKHSSLLNCTKYCYLGAVHMDIAFGNCVSVGRYQYAFILLNRATQYNWTFGLKTLSLVDIITSLCLFCVVAGLLARCFYSDCNLKLFGSAVSKYLIDGQSKVIPAQDLINNQSKVVPAPAKCQSATGLKESHWKGMVHMACTYLTKKQMPCTFWFYLITHAATWHF